MADPFSLRVPDALARKGYDLAVLRDQYYRELYESGRWRHYGSEADIKAKLEETAAEVAKWQAMLTPDDQGPETPPNE